MPFNPSGIFVRLYRWVTDRDNNIAINSTRMDAEMDGMVAGLNAIVSQTQPFTGVLKGPSGTVLTPAYSFGNDPNTGVYRAGEDAVGIAAGGANVATFDATGMASERVTTQSIEVGGKSAAAFSLVDFHSNGVDTSTDYDTRIYSVGGLSGTPGRGSLRLVAGQVQAPNGAAAIPAIGFTSDTDTGIYRDAADSIGFAAGGASVATMGATGVTAVNGFNGPAGTEAAPAVQFSNANNGIYWEVGAGPRFTAAGATIARLAGGTALATADALVTRQAGDVRYVQDAAAVKTTGAQTIAGAKTFTGLSIWEVNTGGQRFIKDAVVRSVADFYTSTSTLAFVQRMTADGSLEFQGAGDRAFRIIAPVVFGLGDGEIYFENNAQDGNGAGLCLRTSVNPTGNGMIFSVRSSGGGLGFGVQQDGVVSGRADMYLGANDAGAGGSRVMHVGITAGGIGSLAFARRAAGAALLNFGDTAAGSSLTPANANGSVGSTPALTGTWRCLGCTTASGSGEQETTLYQRIS